MKKIIVILLLLVSLASYGQAPAFRWVKEMPFEILCQCAYGEDNIYIAGDFKDTIVFENNTLQAQGFDVIVAKYHSSGSLLWFHVPPHAL